MYETHSDFVKDIEGRKITPGIFKVKMGSEIWLIEFSGLTEKKVG
jgi:hypothetical protein